MSSAALPCVSQQRAGIQLSFQTLFSLCLKTKGNQGLQEKSRRLLEKESYISTEQRKKPLFWRIQMLLYWSHFALRLWAQAELQAAGKLPLPRSSRCNGSTANAFLCTSWAFTHCRFSFLLSTQRTTLIISEHLCGGDLHDKQHLLKNFGPFAYTVPPPFAWVYFWKPCTPIAFQDPSQLEEWTFPKGKLVFVLPKMELHVHLHTQSCSLSFKKLVQMQGFLSLGATWPQDSAVVWRSAAESKGFSRRKLHHRHNTRAALLQMLLSYRTEGTKHVWWCRNTSSEVSEVIFNQMCIFTV